MLGPITRAVLKGFLTVAFGTQVNTINAPSLAESLGMKINESRLNTPGDYTECIEVSTGSDGETASVSGAFFGVTPRIVKINDYTAEAKPDGALLILENLDRPGMVGFYGTLMGSHQINIAGMSLSRNKAGGRALVVLNLDTAPDEKVLKEILSVEDIYSARVIQL